MNKPYIAAILQEHSKSKSGPPVRSGDADMKRTIIVCCVFLVGVFCGAIVERKNKNSGGWFRRHNPPSIATDPGLATSTLARITGDWVESTNWPSIKVDDRVFPLEKVDGEQPFSPNSTQERSVTVSNVLYRIVYHLKSTKSFTVPLTNPLGQNHYDCTAIIYEGTNRLGEIETQWTQNGCWEDDPIRLLGRLFKWERYPDNSAGEGLHWRASGAAMWMESDKPVEDKPNTNDFSLSLSNLSVTNFQFIAYPPPDEYETNGSVVIRWTLNRGAVEIGFRNDGAVVWREKR